MSCSSKSLAHVVKFDGSNLPLWRLGLDVALEEHDVQSVTDGTCACPPEVNLFTLKVSSWTQSPLTKTFFSHRNIFKLTSDEYLNRKNKPTKHSLFLLQVRQIIEPVPPVEGQNPAAQTLGPIINAEAIKDWKVKDCTARRILLATIELKLQNTLVGCKTAFQIWTRLNSQHNKCAANNKYVVQRNFLNYDYQKGNFFITQNEKTNSPTRNFSLNPGHDAMSHISAIETIAEQLRNTGDPQTRL